jgi:hypothetical protein
MPRHTFVVTMDTDDGTVVVCEATGRITVPVGTSGPLAVVHGGPGTDECVKNATQALRQLTADGSF